MFCRKPISIVKLDFETPEKPGDYSLVLNAICDSYMGCDQEFGLTIIIPES
jgi:pre-mRNA-splicing helicase BRR2